MVFRTLMETSFLFKLTNPGTMKALFVSCVGSTKPDSARCSAPGILTSMNDPELGGTVTVSSNEALHFMFSSPPSNGFPPVYWLAKPGVYS